MTTRILVVDDEPQFERLVRQRFRRKISSGEYELAFAQNGLHALEILEHDPSFDIVLSDINMPKMDGLTLLSRLREIRPRIRTVMVSAYGDMSNIRAAMNLGAYDFVTKPINFEDLETTIRKTLEEIEISKRAEKARELELTNEKLREIDRMKSHFFTNISHEFRTPLTVISGMADQIREKPREWFSQGLKMIKRNSLSLLNLVNQILDLAKLESGKLQLNMIQGDVVGYLRYILESFQSLAENKNIQLEFQPGEAELVMDHDPERLMRIVSNLLSNAVKFTQVGGKIFVRVERTDSGSCTISIRDTGIGIPPDRAAKIFDRFYQVDATSTREGEGTGIGLALTKELVNLMEGEITVESAAGQGTTFRVTLPVRRSAELQPQRHEVPLPDEAELMPPEAPFLKDPGPFGETDAKDLETAADRPTLLIVEDNADIVEYLRSCLESRYELLIARDGQEGIDRAVEEVPDLIVSDVMMPHKDGFELCRTLKADERTSHIPIVLLTAKADQDSKVEGLSKGADAYLAKPFDKNELLIRLEQLLELRRKLQARYQNLESIDAPEDEAVRQEDAFLMKVRKEVEENIDDENMSISGLARAIGVSRAQLHNKISALTGRSPSVFVRTIRLYKARELLKTSDLNISQIAYEVGFRDPAYFSRTYSEEFGRSPKDSRS